MGVVACWWWLSVAAHGSRRSGSPCRRRAEVVVTVGVGVALHDGGGGDLAGKRSSSFD